MKGGSVLRGGQQEQVAPAALQQDPLIGVRQTTKRRHALHPANCREQYPCRRLRRNSTSGELKRRHSFSSVLHARHHTASPDLSALYKCITTTTTTTTTIN